MLLARLILNCPTEVTFITLGSRWFPILNGSIYKTVFIHIYIRVASYFTDISCVTNR